MKSIHFDNLSSKKHYLPILFGVGVLLVLYFIFKGTKHEKLLILILNLFAFISLFRMFWYKAHVQYNTSRRILTRINSTSQINIIFDNLTDIEYAKDKLILTENTKTHKIDIEDVNPNDVQKLINLMIQRSEAFYKDSSHLKYYE
ncbi:hypothetical protein [Psychroflexus montanilacus]|uniref:hypothetical protein n=1 Tax=Psychroflexus montanilacus TaxID=2873598 RepID=UPI001CCD3176|nr:hypothetical protein [Psychroflexus montanilacus]MBZ9651344.1 hypothetical protein [Psychroflexus montanilacus]